MATKTQTTTEKDKPAGPKPQVVLPLSSEATMIAYLMEVGWELHVAHDIHAGHKLFKATTKDKTTTVEQLNVEADTVIELHNAKMLRRKRRFRVNHDTTTVYVRGRTQDEARALMYAAIEAGWSKVSYRQYFKGGGFIAEGARPHENHLREITEDELKAK